jgi:hypothetical protein
MKRVHVTFTSGLSEETHLLEFMPKTVGHHQGDRTNPYW